MAASADIFSGHARVGCYRHLVGRGQRCYKHPIMPRTAPPPQQKSSGPKVLSALLRNPALMSDTQFSTVFTIEMN